ncbi:hypothetical protein DEJ34_00505 [Curtobacterium sp. MCPF17_050]|uniref:hypothetical protein n=1 Tax=Curtobacterium sp. MCPF17_050 TaxID=2175664 RepID=UPI0015E89CFE|nr:hypothetical protein [Curtobacterium sp. MCPF17_050]WIB15643.1 hypothetical protein DEJ34_00505 [Curtobacterium sp. MCPF17_050]
MTKHLVMSRRTVLTGMAVLAVAAHNVPALQATAGQSPSAGHRGKLEPRRRRVPVGLL